MFMAFATSAVLITLSHTIDTLLIHCWDYYFMLAQVITQNNSHYSKWCTPKLLYVFTAGSCQMSHWCCCKHMKAIRIMFALAGWYLFPLPFFIKHQSWVIRLYPLPTPSGCPMTTVRTRDSYSDGQQSMAMRIRDACLGERLKRRTSSFLCHQGMAEN